MAQDGSQTDNGDRPVTLKDIAERCGVTVMTVSRALRGDSKNTAQATIETIREIANELGYDPSRHSAARRLVLSRTSQRVLNNSIGLLFYVRAFERADYFRLMFQGVLNAAVEDDFQVFTADEWNLRMKNMLPVAYRKGDIDGVLTLASPNSDWDVIRTLLRNDPGFRDRPIVGLVEHLDGCSGVYADHYDAGYQVMTHLLDLGHKYVMMTASYLPDDPRANGLRSAAYRKAYQERGMDASQYLLPSLWNPDEYEFSKKRLVRQLELHPQTTALIARNDYDAVIIYDALVDAGIRVPEDISLIGYDDTETIVVSDRENILTSVHFPITQIAYEGTKLLVRRIMGEEKEDRDVVLPVELIARKSTAPPSK